MVNIESISELHDILGCTKPKHPLITLIDYNTVNPRDSYYNVPFKLNFYMISLKNNAECELIYGRKYYDFHEGSLMFTAPGQILAKGSRSGNEKRDGWMLVFHPDLIRGSALWHKLPEYSFFEYEANEALHLSDQEKEIVDRIVSHIQVEYSGNLDTYSNDLLLSNLEVLLNYAKRFYGRQFITRTAAVKDSVVKFERLLQEHCTTEAIEKAGMPSVKRLAQEMGYSPNYLSDMLKKETGKTAQEFIKLHMLEIAKRLLLTTKDPIYLIAERLGFEQPSSFTKFIKMQLGVSPAEYRRLKAE
ncbi:AraC family transcriptional regulator [Cohnella boryungensis]|uniref:Helix-turn-helix domain-containing protein n=1 Tax=Cohnella boryungensis TaxID=768479 RepID=A0ABV8SFF0_9BACL